MDKGTPSQQDFDKLLRWLDPDRDLAGKKYTKIQLRLIRIFSSRGCCDVEDLADKTFNVIMLKIDWLMENYVGDPAPYFYGVAKKIYLETLKKKPPPEPSPIEPTPPGLEEVCAQLDECLQELSAADRNLALGYHEGEKQQKIKNRRKLAEELKTSRNALRIKVHYIHARLRECIERLQRCRKLNETPCP
jgi:hypothetical protein